MKRAKHIDNVDRKTLTVRMLSPTYWDLVLIAKEQNRSINGQIMQFVLEGMARYIGEKNRASYAGITSYSTNDESLTTNKVEP